MAWKRNSAHPWAEVNSTIVPFKLSGIGIAPNLVNATVNRVPAEVVITCPCELVVMRHGERPSLTRISTHCSVHCSTIVSSFCSLILAAGVCILNDRRGAETGVSGNDFMSSGMGMGME